MVQNYLTCEAILLHMIFFAPQTLSAVSATIIMYVGLAPKDYLASCRQKAAIQDRTAWHLREKSSFYLLMMALHSFHIPWTESQNSTLLEEDVKRANWARPRKVKRWEKSLLERQQEQEDQLSAREAALGGIVLSLLVATILGQVDAIKTCLTN